MRHSLLNLALLTLNLAAIPASALAANPSPEISAEADGPGAGGYDVTAYFDQGQAVRGSAARQFQFQGAIWCFASTQSLAKFKADPAAFAPQFGGYCAWAVSQGYFAPGDPR